MNVPTPAIRPVPTPLDPVALGVADDIGFEPERRHLDIKALLSVLRRNWVLIASVLALALVCGFLATVLATPQYEATASVQINQEADRVLDTEQDVEPVSSTQDAERFLQTQVDVLRSRAMAISVGQSLKLFGNPRFQAAMGVSPEAPGLNVPLEQFERERTLALLREHLRVDLPRNSSIAEISFRSADPALSAQIANGFAKNFITANLQRKYNSTAYARDFLSSQLVEAKARLEESERGLNAYARAAGLIATRSSAAVDGTSETRAGQSITNASLSQLNQSLNQAKAARIAAEAKWRSASATPLLSIPEVLTNEAIQGLQEQRALKLAALSEERARHRDEHPAVREAAAQVADLGQQIQTLAASVRTSIRDQFEVAASQERALAQQVAGLTRSTLNEQDRSVRFNILSREVDTNRTLYDGLLQRYKELSAAAGIATNNISVIDTAEPPLRPVSPRLAVNLALALLAGLVLAALSVFVREQIDDAVRGPADIERKLGLHVLGTVPLVEGQENVLELLREPRSPVTEAYAALRSSLLYATASGLPRSLLVTSSHPAEGKSTSAFAIATSLAKLGKRVVLVDGDLRRPTLHQSVNLPNAGGLTDLLVNARSVDDVLARPQGLDFHVILSGPIPPSPTDLLGTPRLREIIDELVRRFDIVVVDGPPVLGLADAPMLGAELDATLVVVEANRGYGGRTKGAIRRLRDARARLIGAALTKFDARRAGLHGEYGYEYYAYGYALGDGRPKRALS